MGGRQLPEKNSEGLNMREVAAKSTLQKVRRQGHTYVEFRLVGRRTIFFCTLCQTQCFNDSVLNDHLNGNFHSRRLAAAKITLFGPTPWPFNDGALFFDTSYEDVADNGSKNCSNVAKNGTKNCLTSVKGLVIRGVLVRDEVRNMKAHFIGYGHIGIRIHEINDMRRSIGRIWCAWLGHGDSGDCKELMRSPKLDFALVSFSYTYTLGKRATLDEFDIPLSPGSYSENDDLYQPMKKLRKSFSDPEDLVEDTADSSDRVCTSKHLSSRSLRRELRKQKRLNSERTCDICGQKMLLGKDVATLFNRKTGKLACSSRNANGAFHLFHTSCLVHWMLLFESETWNSQPTNVKTTTRGRKAKAAQRTCYSLVCPQCQGTGIHIEGDELEKPSVPLSEIFLLKLKAIEAQKSWMKNPEDLRRCSTGLQFPSDSSENFQIQEKVMPLKLVHFYRADE